MNEVKRRIRRELFRHLARELRYRTLESLIGGRLRFESPELIVPACEEFVRALDPRCRYAGPPAENRLGAMAKYAILDLRFAAPPEWLTQTPPAGISLMKQLGFAEPVDAFDATSQEDALWFLNHALEEARRGPLELRLYLEDVGKSAIDIAECLRRFNDLTLLPFPCEYVVVDACLTNCRSAWLNKHFYL